MCTEHFTLLKLTNLTTCVSETLVVNYFYRISDVSYYLLPNIRKAHTGLSVIKSNQPKISTMPIYQSDSYD